MRSGLGFVMLLLAASAAGGAHAQDSQRRDHPTFRLPDQPDFSDMRPDSRPDARPDRGGEPGGRLRLRTGPEDNFRSDRIVFGADSAEARLRELGVRDGSQFGGRGRLYFFAADGQTAVGYNLTHGDDGWSRDGLSVDPGAFMGDAQAGIAWRQGDFQTSFGYVQRTIEKEGHLGRNLDEDIVAFHVSFVPGR